MHRHLPQKPEPRYWVTGNYIFDYRDSKFGIGAMLQTFLVGDPKTDMPVVAFFKFDTEALGKFTGQLAVCNLSLTYSSYPLCDQTFFLSAVYQSAWTSRCYLADSAVQSQRLRSSYIQEHQDVVGHAKSSHCQLEEFAHRVHTANGGQNCALLLFEPAHVPTADLRQQ